MPQFTFGPGNGYAVSFARSDNGTDSYKVRTIYLQAASAFPLSDEVPFGAVHPSFGKMGPDVTFDDSSFPRPRKPRVLTVSPLSGYELGPRGDVSLP